MDVIQLSSGNEINIPWRNVTPVNPIVVIIDVDVLSNNALTTQSALTTNPRNLPVVADVPETTLHPVYPAENDPAAIDIILYF
jgi:hypothetical protein